MVDEFNNNPGNDQQNPENNSMSDSIYEKDTRDAASEDNVINFKKDEESGIKDKKEEDPGINNYTMDKRGNIKADSNGTAAVVTPKTFIVLGWISAAFTFLVSPWFAVAGIAFGVLANRQSRSSGNVVIITNIVLAVLNLLFGIGLVYFLGARRVF